MVRMYLDDDEERRDLMLVSESKDAGAKRLLDLQQALRQDEAAEDRGCTRLCTTFALSFIQRVKASLKGRKPYQGKAPDILVGALDLDRHCPRVQLRKNESELSVWALHRIRGWIQIYPIVETA